MVPVFIHQYSTGIILIPGTFVGMQYEGTEGTLGMQYTSTVLYLVVLVPGTVKPPNYCTRYRLPVDYSQTTFVPKVPKVEQNEVK